MDYLELLKTSEKIFFDFDESYKLYFDFNLGAFCLRFRENRPFILGFETIKDVYKLLHSYFVERNFNVHNSYILCPAGNSDGFKFIKLECGTNEDFNYGLDFFILRVQYFDNNNDNPSGGKKISEGKNFYMTSPSAIRNFLELQPRVFRFIFEYEYFVNIMNSVKSLLLKAYIDLRINQGNENLSFRILNTPDTKEDALIERFFKGDFDSFVSGYLKVEFDRLNTVPGYTKYEEYVYAICNKAVYRNSLVQDIKKMIHNMKKCVMQNLLTQVNCLTNGAKNNKS